MLFISKETNDKEKTELFPTTDEVITELRKRTMWMPNYDDTYQGYGLINLMNYRGGF